MDATIHALAARVRNTRSAAASTDPTATGRAYLQTHLSRDPAPNLRAKIRLIAALGGGLRGKRHDCLSRRCGHSAMPPPTPSLASLSCETHETCVSRTGTRYLKSDGRGALMFGNVSCFKCFNARLCACGDRSIRYRRIPMRSAKQAKHETPFPRQDGIASRSLTERRDEAMTREGALAFL